jgi:hypothetical protein
VPCAAQEVASARGAMLSSRARCAGRPVSSPVPPHSPLSPAPGPDPAPPQGYSSITLLEQGFNFDYTKALLRLLRNRGVLAALPVAEKEQLAAWLTGRQLYGSATYFFQVTGLRRCVGQSRAAGLCGRVGGRQRCCRVPRAMWAQGGMACRRRMAGDQCLPSITERRGAVALPQPPGACTSWPRRA